MCQLVGNKTEDEINGQLAMLMHIAKIEAQVEERISYWDCFKGVDLRRTEICCMAFAGQILSRSAFAYSPSYFFTTAGMDPSRAYQLSLGGTEIAFVGTILLWWLITHLGRQTLYVTGQAILCATLFLTGILNCKSIIWAQAAFCIFWLFIYSLTVGPIAYAIVSETSLVRLCSPLFQLPAHATKL
jgi:SP family general alpha glucoside:H+ symporter-like MFS transporter